MSAVRTCALCGAQNVSLRTMKMRTNTSQIAPRYERVTVCRVGRDCIARATAAYRIRTGA